MHAQNSSTDGSLLKPSPAALGEALCLPPGRGATSPPFVDIGGGHRLFVRDWGEGPPVVLLAGWAMDSRIWGDVMIALNARGLRTVAYDRRGHGRSTDPGRADYDLLADDLAAVLSGLELEGVTLVCHSGASGEAIRAIARHGSDRLRRLVFVGATGPRMIAEADGAPGLTPEMVRQLTDRIATDLPRWIDENIEPFAPGLHSRLGDWVAAMVQDCSRRILLDFQHEIATANFHAELRALPIPMTLIHGNGDVSAPIDLTARRYAALLPDAELLVYDRAAHGLMFTHAARLAGDIAERVSR